MISPLLSEHEVKDESSLVLLLPPFRLPMQFERPFVKAPSYSPFLVTPSLSCVLCESAGLGDQHCFLPARLRARAAAKNSKADLTPQCRLFALLQSDLSSVGRLHCSCTASSGGSVDGFEGVRPNAQHVPK